MYILPKQISAALGVDHKYFAVFWRFTNPACRQKRSAIEGKGAPRALLHVDDVDANLRRLLDWYTPDMAKSLQNVAAENGVA